MDNPSALAEILQDQDLLNLITSIPLSLFRETLNGMQVIRNNGGYGRITLTIEKDTPAFISTEVSRRLPRS
jgi:hypothetical protein